MHAKSFNTPAFLGLLGNSTFGLVQFLVIMLYPALSESLGLHISHVILCFTLGSVLFIWSSPFWAKKSDEFGRQKILSLGLAGLSISFLVLIFLNQMKLSTTFGFVVLLCSRIFYGMTASAVVSVVQAWWRDQPGEVSKHMLSHSMGLNLGRLIAPLLIIVLSAEIISLLWVLFIWTGALSLCAFLVKATNTQKELNDETDQKWAFSSMSLPVVIALLSTLFIGILHSNLAHFVQTSMDLTSAQTTMLCSRVLLMNSVAVLVFQLSFRFVPKLKGAYLIWIGVPAWVLATVCLQGMNSEAQLWLAIFFLSIGLAGIAPGYLSLLKAGGRSAGIISSTQTLGLTLGGLVGVLIVQGHVSLSTALFFLCAMLIFAAGLIPRPQVSPC